MNVDAEVRDDREPALEEREADAWIWLSRPKRLDERGRPLPKEEQADRDEWFCVRFTHPEDQARRCSKRRTATIRILASEVDRVVLGKGVANVARGHFRDWARYERTSEDEPWPSAVRGPEAGVFVEVARSEGDVVLRADIQDAQDVPRWLEVRVERADLAALLD